MLSIYSCGGKAELSAVRLQNQNIYNMLIWYQCYQIHVFTATFDQINVNKTIIIIFL